ncbi:MAG TPA: type II toxin-antitoxin system RelE/ParE family toxin [Thermodesulforhabdus norvegica]|uniref:Type II toxin-antitoxin system RelE/ParE family toxin n=1 Tax=Thermodesulforhabdus norvegica TaxID=39841 RepID=A0A7C1AZN0_9BACT|nr:type II toxin-antitoxin system RelE/ParE family toxin [Thermodesulforhabdus norvegica]
MIDLTRHAQGFLKGLQPKQFKQVANKIFSLVCNPYPEDYKHLAGHPGFRRIDVGEFRVCYEVYNGIVRIAVVGPRNDAAVYKKLKRVDG